MTFVRRNKPPASRVFNAAGDDGLRRPTRRRVIFGALGLVGALGSATTAYAAGVEPLSLNVTRYRLNPPAWPAGRRLTVTAIADIHAGGPNMGIAQIRRIVDVANLLRSDLVVLLGDYVATHPFVTERVPDRDWATELARLRAPFGVHAILGNHDWWFGIAGIRAALVEAGIPVMENDAVRLGRDGERFWLAGIGDQLAYRLGNRTFRGIDDLPGTLARVTTDDPVILLVHEPDIFPKVPERVALTLAGHTHGGQLRLPFIWPALVPSKYGARYAYGHIVEDGRHMLVSGGLGTSMVPLRLRMPPEIVQIELGATPDV
jgi:predicted MPP superfamily phosphohydrolase